MRSFPHLNVADNVAFGLKYKKVTKAERAQAVGEALSLVQLTGFEKRRPGQLSGEIRADSDGAGRGTTITIRLPIGATSPAVAPLPQPPVAAVHGELRLDGATVVVVDDERDSREMLGALFERCGACVTQCDGAESALVALEARAVHLLVADIAMPDMDGYDLIQRVRQRPNGVPAIAVSAYARAEDRSKALALGFNAYCAKPLEELVFLEAIRRVMQPA